MTEATTGMEPSQNGLAAGFDFHGLELRVSGARAMQHFRHEYGAAFQRSLAPTKSGVRIAPEHGDGRWTVTPRGTRGGVRVRLGQGPASIGYHPALHPSHLPGLFESVARWPDKALVHAGAVASRQGAHLFLAGPNVGKTTLVTRLLRDGYRYLADDWALVGRQGAFLWPKAIHLYDYNLASDQELCAQLRGRYRHARPWYALRTRARNLAARHAPGRPLRFATQVIFDRMVASARPESLGSLAMPDGPLPLAAVSWIERAHVAKIEIRPVEGRDLASRAVHTLVDERAPFFGAIAREAAREGLEDWLFDHVGHQREIIQRAFSGRPCQVITIPERMDGAALAEHARGWLGEPLPRGDA